MGNIDTRQLQVQFPTEIHAINPKASYHRVCPNCNKQHVVRNRGRDFCSDWCADTYYNYYRRNLRQARVMIAERGGQVMVTEPIKPLQINVPAPAVDKYSNNIAFLDRLSIDLMKGNTYYINDLIKNNFAFDHFSERVELHNTKSTDKCYALKYSSYTIFFINKQTVLISKTI